MELWDRVCRWLELDQEEEAIAGHCVEPEVVVISKPRKVRSPVSFSPDSWIHGKGQSWLRQALRDIDTEPERGQTRVKTQQSPDSGISLSFDEDDWGSKKKSLRVKGRKSV